MGFVNYLNKRDSIAITASTIQLSSLPILSTVDGVDRILDAQFTLLTFPLLYGKGDIARNI